VSGDERPLEEGLRDPAVPNALTRGDLEILGLLPNSSNYSFLAKATAGDEELLVVYKPQRGEIPLWDFPTGTLHRREAAAYVVARELGWPDVPPTIVREGPEGVGSAQLFVDFDPTQHYFTMEAERAQDFRKVAAFDLVINNADRKAGHCLLGTDGRIWLIDHGVCFNEEPKLRTVIWEFAGEPIEAGLLADLRRFADSLTVPGPAREALAALLSGEELAATAHRTEAVVSSGVYPEPGDGRPYPWPPI